MKKILSSAVFLFLFLNASCLFAQTISQNGYSYELEPQPAWVEEQPLPLQATALQGVRQLLLDFQLNWVEKEPVRYLRLVSEVVASNGINAAAKYQLEFDPNYQKLTIHALRIKRGGQWFDRTGGKNIELLRRENNLDTSSQYDGSITLSVNMSDVRVGDVVELAYSIKGSNPVFSSGRSSMLPLGSSQPIGRIAVKLTAPEDMEVFYKVLASEALVDVKKEKGQRVLRLVRDQVPAIIYEDKAPDSVLQVPFLQLSTYQNWEQVSAWGEGLFNITPPKSDEFKRKVEELKAIKKDSDKIAAALNFVQEDIRYFGVEIVANSHQPYPPDQVIQQRYGDCKDKTLLLHSLLKALGIKSTPTLASFNGGGLNQYIPSPSIFDHVILMVEDGNKTYWLDSTRTGQGRSLSSIGTYDYGFVLPLRGAPKQLTRITLPRTQPAELMIKESWKAADLSAKSEVSVDTTFTFEEAERFRQRLKSEGVERIQESWLDFLKKRYPLAEVVRQVEVNDDPIKNLITTHEVYRLDESFKFANGYLTFDIEADELSRAAVLPEKSGRKYPVAQDTRTEYTYSYTLDSPFIRKVTPQNKLINGPYLNYAENSSGKPGHLEVVLNLKAVKNEVPANETSSYIRQVQSVRASLQKTYNINIADPEAFPALQEQVRNQYADVRPEIWRDELVKRASANAAWTQLLKKQNPSRQIESEILTNLAWGELEVGGVDKAFSYLERLRAIQTEDSSEVEQLSAITHAYLIEPTTALEHFKKYRNLASKEDIWSDARTEGFIYLTGPKPEQAIPVFENALNTDSQHQESLARWYALSLRLTYSAGASALKKWNASGFEADKDYVSYDVLYKKSADLAEVANALLATDPGAAIHIWLACGLEAQKRGQLDVARTLYQKIIDSKLSILPQYNLAQGLLAKMKRH